MEGHGEAAVALLAAASTNSLMQWSTDIADGRWGKGGKGRFVRYLDLCQYWLIPPADEKHVATGVVTFLVRFLSVLDCLASLRFPFANGKH